MARSKLQSVIVFICVMAAVAALIYSVQYHREKQKAEAAAQVTRKADQEAAQKQQQAEQLAAAAKAVQDATAEHERFVDKYVDIGISKIAGSQMVAVAVASESRSMNHSVGAALVNRFKTDHVQLTDSFFKPELIADGLFNNVFNGSSDLFNKLELAKSLDAVLLARQNVQYETNNDLDNVITANMTLEISALPVAGQIQSQSWTFTANGTGFDNV